MLYSIGPDRGRKSQLYVPQGMKRIAKVKRGHYNSKGLFDSS